MDIPSGIEIGVNGLANIVRVSGRGTHLNSHLLKRFARQAIEKKLSIQFDLGACTYMDSTFLGMLAGLAMRGREQNLPAFRVLNISERVRGMMENLGIDRLFDFSAGPGPAAVLQPLKGEAASAAERALNVLEAHRTLSAVSPANEVKFRDVIALLEEESARSPIPEPE